MPSNLRLKSLVLGFLELNLGKWSSCGTMKIKSGAVKLSIVFLWGIVELFAKSIVVDQLQLMLLRGR